MVIAPPIHRESTPDDEFLVARFGTDALLNAARTLDRESKMAAYGISRGSDEMENLRAVLAILQASGLHALGSFNRTDPPEQLMYVVPFLRKEFGTDETSMRDLFSICHKEYENFERVRTNQDGDSGQAFRFLFKLYKAGYSHWHSHLGIRYSSTH